MFMPLWWLQMVIFTICRDFRSSSSLKVCHCFELTL